jgi:predicted Zn-dependent peptidase
MTPKAITNLNPPSKTKQMPKQQTIVLPNGLRVVLLPLPKLHSTSLMYAVRCGSRHEAPNQWGLSHFLEHMMFRGSRRHPSIGALMRVFEGAGGSLDAGTWRDHTHYSISVHPTALQQTIQTLGDMFTAPRFAELPIERAIVIEEIQGDLDELGKDSDLTNLSRACLWGSQALGRRVTGSIDQVRQFKRADLQSHHRRFYGGRNSVLCIAGSFDPAQAAAWAQKSFAELPAGEPAQDGPRPCLQSDCRFCRQDYDASQLALQLSYPALPDTHPDFWAQRLLSNVLDDGMASRLPHVLSDRLGLVYDLSSGLDCYADVGAYDIEMQLAPEQAQAALQAVEHTLGELCRLGVGVEEFEHARTRWLHELDFRQDDGAGMAEQAALQALFATDAPLSSAPLQEEAARLARLVPADLLRVARRLFEGTQPHLTALGPLQRACLDAGWMPQAA